MSAAWKKKKKKPKKPHKRSRARKTRTTSVWWGYSDYNLPHDSYDVSLEGSYNPKEEETLEQDNKHWEQFVATTSYIDDCAIQFVGDDTAKIYELIRDKWFTTPHLFLELHGNKFVLCVVDDNDKEHFFSFGKNLMIDGIYCEHKDLRQYVADLESVWFPGTRHDPEKKTITFLFSPR